MTIVDVHRMRKRFEADLSKENGFQLSTNCVQLKSISKTKIKELEECLEPIYKHIHAYNEINKRQKKNIFRSSINWERRDLITKVKPTK